MDLSTETIHAINVDILLGDTPTDKKQLVLEELSRFQAFLNRYDIPWNTNTHYVPTNKDSTDFAKQYVQSPIKLPPIQPDSP